MPKDDINYSFTENGVVYDFYDVFVPAVYFRQPQLWGWGLNNFGQLALNNVITSKVTPVTTFAGGTNWKSLSVSGAGSVEPSCVAAIKTDGTLWLWGRNANGQLGTNDTTDRRTPVTTILGGNDWKQVANGSESTLAIKTDGSLWGWGLNNSGQLGVDDNIRRSTPVTTILGGNDWKQVSAKGSHTAAIKTDGSLWTWGNGSNGLLGTNNTASRSTPVTTFLGGNNWKQVSCGLYIMTAVKTDGSLWVWGAGGYGNLGVNSTLAKLTPVTTFLGGFDWKKVSAGYRHVGAIKTDGSLWMWGGDFPATSSAYLGINDNSVDRWTPVTTFAGGNDWKEVSCGSRNTAAIKTDGSLWTWGEGANGALGVGDTFTRSTPVTTILGGNEWKQVLCTNDRFNPGAVLAIKYTPDP